MQVQLRNGRTVRLGGIAHGDSQGVQAIISCDASVEAQLWRSMHARAVAASFNQLAMPGSGTAPPTGGYALAHSRWQAVRLTAKGL